MKPGTLVICIDDKNILNDAKPIVNGRIYTIREIAVYQGTTGVYLDEITNNLWIDGTEIGYKIERFRELNTPIKINIEEFIKEKSCIE